MIANPRVRRNSDVLIENLALAGRSVVDIGCGDGGLCRLMARHGARVLGVEPSHRQVQKARQADQEAAASYVQGLAQALPLPDRSVDIVVFFNSLHHVPENLQELAMAEAARVLRPGGVVYVSEPIALGAHFELVRPVADETRVRARAEEAIRNAARHGLRQDRELTYIHRVLHRDFASFRDRIIAADAGREPVFERNEADLRAAFHRLGRRDEDGWAFDQPTRVNLLRKADGNHGCGKPFAG